MHFRSSTDTELAAAERATEFRSLELDNIDQLTRTLATAQWLGAYVLMRQCGMLQTSLTREMEAVAADHQIDISYAWEPLRAAPVDSNWDRLFTAMSDPSQTLRADVQSVIDSAIIRAKSQL